MELDTAFTNIGEPLQDGLLKFYLSCAGASDVNVERRIEREPFFVNDYLKCRIEQSSAGKATRKT